MELQHASRTTIGACTAAACLLAFLHAGATRQQQAAAALRARLAAASLEAAALRCGAALPVAELPARLRAMIRDVMLPIGRLPQYKKAQQTKGPPLPATATARTRCRRRFARLPPSFAVLARACPAHALARCQCQWRTVRACLTTLENFCEVIPRIRV